MLRFKQEDDLGSATQLKSSVGRAIQRKLEDQMPNITPLLPVLFPKKSPIYQLKTRDRSSFVACNGQVLFFQHRDGPFYPTIKLLHQYPNLLPRFQVDRGAIKFVLSGADIMCPGLTSPGAKMEADVDVGTPVAIFAEGKEHALALGETVMSTEDIRKINKDVGVKSISYLDDGLWHLDPRGLNIN
ncbi:uncharacterized protein MONBRDRAFT_13627 [Monosiga brevicollis MX1]|uniref:PUA domain-containing protein n=1 Tax=Monosiga brevicollis TaxID=81824 RepID=A9UPW0_MONBE|nr:uncharacterized protein MONBRDRAFT_13627 [Monosiga brevicollis MX1]EDQ92943.1 predicted protein [Monosiga brevicollis MX1]|eukprot:XP_001742705.1 hypothetical protein [Monosiga brevicollis MX1]